MRILGIETSCDETGIAVVEGSGPDTLRLVVAELASQADLHAETGGVVPDVAAREHVVAIGPLLRRVRRSAGFDPAQLDAIAVTVGPGLVPALVVGIAAARALSSAWKKPLVPVHHIEGHVYSAWLTLPDWQAPSHTFPLLILVVSGGHTELSLMRGHGTYTLLGATRDDAAGEAFDKVAQLLGLSYPGGPAIEEAARDGNPHAVAFPRPMMQSGDLDFSYSGLKAAVARHVHDWPTLSTRERADIAASFQEAVIESLHTKVQRALQQTGARELIAVGGVMANTRLRERLATLSIPVTVPPLSLCTDNAAMIAAAGLMRFSSGEENALTRTPFSRMTLETVSRPAP